MQIRLRFLTLILVAAGLLTGCFGQELPDMSDLPIPIPTNLTLPNLENLPDYLKDLQLPDLSQIQNLPSLNDLPGLQAPDNGVLFAGPTERKVEVGQTLPGTDIQLISVSNDGAEFTIAGLRSTRRAGDSLDFDGPWPNIDGVTYNARLRIYTVGDDSVRVAGVHRLVVENVNPTNGSPALSSSAQFPSTSTVAKGAIIPGTTFRYVGTDERGAQIGGLPEGDYPYFKVGDSLVWQGTLRDDIAARYMVRVLFYTENSLQIGGIIALALP